MHKSAIFATRESPDPSDADARIVQRRAKRSVNEAAALQSLLPMYLPVLDIYNGDDDDNLFTVPDQMWDKRVSQQFNPDMDNTNSTETRSNDRLEPKIFPYPRALASLGPYAYPLVQTSKLLFPAFTVEGKGDLGIFASTYYRACYMRHRLSRNAMSNIDSLSLNSSLNC